MGRLEAQSVSNRQEVEDLPVLDEVGACFSDICKCFDNGRLIQGTQYLDLHDRFVWLLMRLSFEVGVDEAMCTIADIIVNEHARSTMGKVNHISFLDDLAVGFEKMVVGVQNGIRERTKGALETKVVRGPGNRRSVAIHVVYPEVQVGL